MALLQLTNQSSDIMRWCQSTFTFILQPSSGRLVTSWKEELCYSSENGLFKGKTPLSNWISTQSDVLCSLTCKKCNGLRFLRCFNAVSQIKWRCNCCSILGRYIKHGSRAHPMTLWGDLNVIKQRRVPLSGLVGYAHASRVWFEGKRPPRLKITL